MLDGAPPNRVPRGGPQEGKTGRSVPPFGVPESAQTFSAFFRKLQNYHWKRPFWSEGENYLKMRPLNRLRMPCNVHGETAMLQGLAALQFKNLFTESSQIVFAITFNNNFYQFVVLLKHNTT